jgi:hypothetical protein
LVLDKGNIIRIIQDDKKEIPPKPATYNKRLLKSSFSRGKGWKKRIKRKTPKLIINNLPDSSLSDFLRDLSGLFKGVYFYNYLCIKLHKEWSRCKPG